MDAIKKKMQAMKIAKDNAMDRADQCEQAAKAAKVDTSVICFLIFCIPSPHPNPDHHHNHHHLDQVRANKAEEEVADLMKKAEQLEVELDKTKEELVIIILMWMVMIMIT